MSYFDFSQDHSFILPTWSYYIYYIVYYLNIYIPNFSIYYELSLTFLTNKRELETHFLYFCFQDPYCIANAHRYFKNLGFWEFIFYIFFNLLVEGFIWIHLVFFYFIFWFCFSVFSRFLFRAAASTDLTRSKILHCLQKKKRYIQSALYLTIYLTIYLESYLKNCFVAFQDWLYWSTERLHQTGAFLSQEGFVSVQENSGNRMVLLLSPFLYWKGWWLGTKLYMKWKSLNCKCFCVPIQTIEYIL
jgi:hypothetical protein